MSVTAVNDAPALAGGGNVLQFSEGDSAIVVNNSLTLSDPEATVVNRVEVVLAGAGSGEQLNFTDTSKIEEAGQWNADLESAINLQSPTNAEFQAAIRTITYSNTNTLTTDGNRTATFTAYEGTGTGLASSTAVSTISVATLTMMLLRWLDCPVVPLPIQNLLLQRSWNLARRLLIQTARIWRKRLFVSVQGLRLRRCACGDRWFNRINGTYTASTGTLEITGTGNNLSISGSAAYGDI